MWNLLKQQPIFKRMEKKALEIDFIITNIFSKQFFLLCNVYIFVYKLVVFPFNICWHSASFLHPTIIELQ